MSDTIVEHLQIAADFCEAGDYLAVHQILASPVVFPILDERNRAMITRGRHCFLAVK